MRGGKSSPPSQEVAETASAGHPENGSWSERPFFASLLFLARLCLPSSFTVCYSSQKYLIEESSDDA